MKKLVSSLSICFLTHFMLFADVCSTNATSEGNDANSVTAAITNFSCTGAYPIDAATLDASIGTFCSSWYSYNIIVNGVTVATQQCDQTGFDLTPYLPLTSVSIVSNDEDSFSDFITLSLTVNLYYTPDCPAPSNATFTTAIDSVFTAWNWTASGPSFPSTGFNLQYGNFGFDLYSGTIVNSDNADFFDTTYNANFIGGALYQMYLQTECGTDTSAWAGPFTFTMPLTNDSVCNAEMILTDGTVYTLNNTGATVQSGEVAIAPPSTGCTTNDGWCNSNLNFTTWFTFIAPTSGKINVSGLDIDFDGQIAVYELTNCMNFNEFTLIAANDDDYLNNIGLAPNFDLCGLTAGSMYYLMHDSYSTSTTGIYSIKLTSMSAGDDGTLTACKNEPIDLFDGLNGTFDNSGVWLDPFNDPLLNSTTSAFSFSAFFNYKYIVPGGSCPNDTAIVLVEVLENCDHLSIIENKLDEILIYPNPSNGLVMLRNKSIENLSISVYNAEGKRIINEVNGENKFSEIELNLESYKPGVYLIKIESISQSRIFRLILQ